MRTLLNIVRCARRRMKPRAQRFMPPLRLVGLTIEHVATGLKYRLSWSHARSLAEAIHTTLDGTAQIGAGGWIVRRNGRRWELDGRRFDIPVTTLTRAQAVGLGTALAKVKRMEAA